jgi:hypothetical protein
VGAVTSYLLKKIADVGLAKAAETLRRSKGKLETDAAGVESALDYHLRDIKNWCGEISFSDLRNPKAIDSVFVPLNVFLHPRRRHVSANEAAGVVSFERLLTETLKPLPAGLNLSTTPLPPKHLIILGQPGAGKTTSMRHVCHQLLHDADFLGDQFDIPLLVRLRDVNPRTKTGDGAEKLSDDDVLLSVLQNLVGLRIAYPSDLAGDENRVARRTLRDRIVIDFLDSVKALIVFEGFDEIVAKWRKDAVVSQLRTLALQLEQSRIVLTSRTGEFNYHIDNMAQFELTPLSRPQIAGFVSRWLGPEDGDRLLAQIEKSPYTDTAIRPLTIAHLCAIYEKAGRIPDKPKTVYRRIVNLLLEEWDEQRSVKRESGYAHFEVDRKSEFLANLAYVLTMSVKRSAYSKDDLISAYEKIYDNFGLPRADAAKVANELESHTGLFVQSGYDTFEFSHKSLQEYLTAEFIVRLPAVPSERRDLLRLPNELAIATAISSRPSQYFTHLVMGSFETLRQPFGFIRAFVTRLLLESPDFERSPVVGAALIALYSRYLQLVQKSSNQLSLFIYDQLASEFSALGVMIRERVPMAELLAVYRIAGTSAGLDGDEIMVLARKPNLKLTLENRMQAQLAQLANEIWVRSSLLAPDDDAVTVTR